MSDGRRQDDAMAPRGARWRAGVRWWVARYGLAELGGLAVALLASALAQRATGNDVVAAYAASLAETAAYYAVILAREFAQGVEERRAGRHDGGWRWLAGRVRRLLLEFGPAEIADLLVLRPAALATCTRMFGRELGVPAGKLVADAIFYGAVIAAYRLQRRESRASAG